MVKMSSFLRYVTRMMDNHSIAEDLKLLNISISDVEQLRDFIEDSLDDNDFGPRCEHCDWTIQDLAVKYSRQYHGYAAIVVCLFGTVANLLTITVLTRKDMVCAPINRILTGIAVADMLLMIEYTSFAYYYYIDLPEHRNFPYWGAVFILFHAHFTQVLHTISICLTLALAIWRYLAIGYPEKNHVYCTENRCTMAITLSYCLPILVCSPTFFVVDIKSTTVIEDKKEYILYHTALSDVATKNDSFLVFNFWMYAVIVKLLPCCILTVISLWLIKTLFKATKRKRELRGLKGQEFKKKTKSERRADRTTKMLVAVLILFLVTEFPQGLFALLIGTKGKCVFLVCYQNFGEIMDILALLNGAINFILYCCMNRMFRATFGQLFKHPIMYKLAPPSQTEVYTTYV